jgi:hypothetical protein
MVIVLSHPTSIMCHSSTTSIVYLPELTIRKHHKGTTLQSRGRDEQKASQGKTATEPAAHHLQDDLNQG